MTEANSENTADRAEDPLERASEQGPLPGSGYLDAQERPGDHDSHTEDPDDERAEEAGEGDVTGGIAFRPE